MAEAPSTRHRRNQVGPLGSFRAIPAWARAGPGFASIATGRTGGFVSPTGPRPADNRWVRSRAWPGPKWSDPWVRFVRFRISLSDQGLDQSSGPIMGSFARSSPFWQGAWVRFVGSPRRPPWQVRFDDRSTLRWKPVVRSHGRLSPMRSAHWVRFVRFRINWSGLELGRTSRPIGGFVCADSRRSRGAWVRFVGSPPWPRWWVRSRECRGRGDRGGEE
jgi:hypothetical protein